MVKWEMVKCKWANDIMVKWEMVKWEMVKRSWSNVYGQTFMVKWYATSAYNAKFKYVWVFVVESITNEVVANVTLYACTAVRLYIL